MKRIRNLSDKVRLKIVADYKAKRHTGDYKYTLKEIAALHEVSLSTVNNLARMADCQGRPQGGKKSDIPSPRDMKVLRDLTIPGITYTAVGIMNPHPVVDPLTGHVEMKPLTRARIHQIVSTWQKRGMPKIKSRGFKKGDRIQWDGQLYTVVRYDNNRRGAVRNVKGEIIDPFCWVLKGKRAVLADGEAPSETALAAVVD